MPNTVNGPRLLVLAGVHGDEREPIEAVRRLEAALAMERVHGSVTLVPEANPTACAAGTRLGADGLDMARSFPGLPDGTPTQQAAHAITERIRRADALIDLHTGGRTLRVLPMTGYMLHRDPVVLDGQRRMARAFGLPVIWGTSAALEGRSLSTARDLAVPAIYAEYGGGDGCDEAAVTAYVSGCLNVMRELGMLAPAAAGPASDRRPLVVEDARDGSGHLQAGHPAPCDGDFRAAVGLGATVRAGDVLGTLATAEGAIHDIRATAAGLVLVLRPDAAARASDPLAVILEHQAGGDGT
jgi:predicted deacylase